MTIPSNPQANVQQQQSTVTRRSTSFSYPTANNPKFRREYTSSFSGIDWGSAASSLSGRPVKSVAGESSNSRTTQSSWGQFASPASSSLASGEMPPIQGEIAPNYGNGTIIVLSVRTKGEEGEKPKSSPSVVETSYHKLKEEYRKKTERSQRHSITDSNSSFDECSRKSVGGSLLSVELPSLHVKTTQEKPTQEKQQCCTATGGKNAMNKLLEKMRNQYSDSDSDAESIGSKRLVQIMQDAEKHFVAKNMFRFPLWRSKLDINELYVPRKQTKQPRLLVGFNGDEEVGGEDKRRMFAQNNNRDGWSLWCQVMVLVLSIVMGAVACTVVVLALGNNFFVHDDKRKNDPSNEQSAYYSSHQQGMLQLAEEITIACGGDLHTSSSVTNCQQLCHQHICCVEQDDEYSCRNDAEKDCAVYAGCVVLIDEIFS